MAFSEVLERGVGGFFRPAHSFLLSGTRLYWIYLVVSLILAWFVWLSAHKRKERGFLSFLFPRSVWTHPSAIVDYKFMVLNSALYAALCAPWVVSLLSMSIGASNALSNLLGPASPPQYQGDGVIVAYGMGLFLAAEFRRYINHWLYHRIPLLWEFHKVHHSAEILTPITFYRVHPVERFLSASADGLAMGLVTGIFVYYWGNEITASTVVSLNAGRWFFVAIGANLRHSHIWLSFGPKIEHFIMSPAQHQIHHSADPRHYDKNFGGALSLWDWLLGTLYIPQGYEELELGLGDRENMKFQSVTALFVRPFGAIFRQEGN